MQLVGWTLDHANDRNPGQPLDPAVPVERAREVMRDAGRDLARINIIAVDGFGWVHRDGAEVALRAEHQDLQGLVAGEYSAHMEHLAGGELSDCESELLREMLNHGDSWFAGGSSRLVHGDLDTSHIYWDGQRYRGIIDFGEIRGMPWSYDLGHHWMHDRERLPFSTMAWLLGGYREIVPLPDDVNEQIAFWSVLIAARALSRGLQRNPSSQIVRIARSALHRDLAHLGATTSAQQGLV